jgi:hypothetical protein
MHQVVIKQDRRDNRVLDLLGVMNDVYALILDGEPLKKIQTQKQALEMLAKQTTECAYFISHYSRQPSFCECDWTCSVTKYPMISAGSRLGKNIMAGVDDKIIGFEQAFQKLRATFQEGVALQTELFVLRMLSSIDAIGKRSPSALCSICTLPTIFV